MIQNCWQGLDCPVGSTALWAVSMVSQATPSMTVTARQRYPWNGLVDIDCTIQGVASIPLAFSAIDNDTGQALQVKTLTLNAEN